MAIQTLDGGLDINAQLSDELIEDMESHHVEIQLDARRRLEQKIEDMRLLRETQDFDLDFDA